MVPGVVVKPHPPPTTAPSRLILRLVPADDVTCICLALRIHFIPALTRSFRPTSLPTRSRISGCSFEIISTRLPDFRIFGNSGACSKPSNVQSMIRPPNISAAMAGVWPASAADAPVERIGTAAVCTGVVTTTCTGLAPSWIRASSLRCTLMLRLWVSDSTTTSSPDCTPESSNTWANSEIHLPSMRSENMENYPDTRCGFCRLWLHYHVAFPSQQNPATETRCNDRFMQNYPADCRFCSGKIPRALNRSTNSRMTPIMINRICGALSIR